MGVEKKIFKSKIKLATKKLIENLDVSKTDGNVNRIKYPLNQLTKDVFGAGTETMDNKSATKIFSQQQRNRNISDKKPLSMTHSR